MKTFTRAGLAGMLAFGMVAVGIGIAVAQDDPANSIKYRQAVMRSMDGHMGALGGIVKGDISFGDHAGLHADAIAATSQIILDLFPEGSDTGAETLAKAEIWQDLDTLSANVEQLQAAAVVLQAAVASGDSAAIGAAFGDVGGACGNCHGMFRAPPN